MRDLNAGGSDSEEGRVCVVTGAGQGIGRACALALAELGTELVLLDLNPDSAASTAREVEARGAGAVAFECDVGDSESVALAFAAARERCGHFDVLVNNAGRGGGARTEELAESEWDAIVDSCLKGTFLCTQQAARSMLEGGRGGVIVNISSMLGVMPMPTRAAYSAAKAGVIAFTKVVAAEWAREGIRVNAVAPGYIRTEAIAAAIEGGLLDEERITEWTPSGRFGKPEEVGAAVRFLASEDASLATGETLVLDGGYTTYGAWWPPAVARDVG
jgi:NAD(P)-dependent dehydrogenase (short-subunit alcohol dehydrogenase family)